MKTESSILAADGKDRWLEAIVVNQIFLKRVDPLIVRRKR